MTCSDRGSQGKWRSGHIGLVGVYVQVLVI